MPFNFSFRIYVPGLSNPFAALAHTETSLDVSYRPDSKRPQAHHNLDDVFPSQPSRPRQGISTSRMSDSWTVLGPSSSRLPTPTPTPSASSSILLPLPASRKRGWIPASAEPSQAIISTSASSGFLDTPSKYRDMVETQDERDQQTEEIIVGKQHYLLLAYSSSHAFSPYLITLFHFHAVIALFASTPSFHPSIGEITHSCQLLVMAGFPYFALFETFK